MEWFLFWMLQFPNEDGSRKQNWEWERYQSEIVSFDECQTLWRYKEYELSEQIKGIQYAGYQILCKQQL